MPTRAGRFFNAMGRPSNSVGIHTNKNVNWFTQTPRDYKIQVGNRFPPNKKQEIL